MGAKAIRSDRQVVYELWTTQAVRAPALRTLLNHVLRGHLMTIHFPKCDSVWLQDAFQPRAAARERCARRDGDTVQAALCLRALPEDILTAVQLLRSLEATRQCFRRRRTWYAGPPGPLETRRTVRAGAPQRHALQRLFWPCSTVDSSGSRLFWRCGIREIQNAIPVRVEGAIRIWPGKWHQHSFSVPLWMLTGDTGAGV